MIDDQNDVVITGYGVVSSIGTGEEAFWKSLEEQRSSIEVIQGGSDRHSRQWIGGVLRDFDAKQHVQPRKSLKVMCLETQISFAASSMAAQKAGITSGSIDSDRIGTVFGSEIIFSENDEIASIVERIRRPDGSVEHSRWGSEAMDHMYPLWMLKSLPNMPACHYGIWIDARGPNNTITTEETSSLVAIMEAAAVIRRNHADCMVVSATGGRTNRVRLLQRYEPHYSTSLNNPSEACKPFDKHRDGTVPGIGAASIILESRASAQRRGAKIIATLSSWANTFQSPTKPWCGSKASVARAITLSVKRAGIQINQIDHVNAAASGRIEMDSNEAHAINDSLGAIPVTATKGYFGDSGASSGLIELCASLAGLERNKVPSTVNFRCANDDCPVNVIHTSTKALELPFFVKTSFTPHGHAAAIVVKNELI